MRDSKQKRVALVVLIVAVIGLTVAFAALSSNLTISGNAKLDPINWDIYFDNIANIKAERKASITSDPIIDTNDKRKINGMSVVLTEPGDKVSFTVDIVSESDIIAVIKDINDTLTVKPEGSEHGFIDFNAYYTDTNVEVKKDDTIVARENGEPSRTNITISVYYSKDKVTNDTLNNIPPGGLEIGFNYGLTFKQYDELVDTTTTDSGFPVLTGSLGDNVTFTYDNGNISIDGTGPMSAGTVVSGGYCDGYQPEENICSLQAELSMAMGNKLASGSDKVDNVINMVAGSFMIGHTFEELGVTNKEDAKAMLMTEDMGSLTEEEAEKALKIIDSIPTLKSITISNGITSIRPRLFYAFNASNLTITFPNTISVKSETVFDVAKIGTITFESGTKTIYEGICKDSDGAIDNIILPDGIKTIETHSIFTSSGTMTTLIIPSSVTTIESNAIYGRNLTTIVNKTGKAFDWNGILTGTSGEAFETGTVNDGSSIITITNK